MVDYGHMCGDSDLALPNSCATVPAEPRTTGAPVSRLYPSSEAGFATDVDLATLANGEAFDVINFDSPATGYLLDLASGGG